jgi:hypothetical protein
MPHLVDGEWITAAPKEALEEGGILCLCLHPKEEKATVGGWWPSAVEQPCLSSPLCNTPTLQLPVIQSLRITPFA